LRILEDFDADPLVGPTPFTPWLSRFYTAAVETRSELPGMNPEGESIKPKDEDEDVHSEDLTWLRLEAGEISEKKIMTRRDSC